MSDLPYTLRQGAIALNDDHTLNWVRDALRRAADFIESAETTERERLEHEAVTPEDLDVPLVPMRYEFAPNADGHRAFTEAMVIWGRIATHRPLDPPEVSDELRHMLDKMRANRAATDGNA